MKYIISLMLLSCSMQLHAVEKDHQLDAFFNNYLSSYADYFAADIDDKDISIVTQHFYPQTLRVPPNSPPGVSKDRSQLAAGFRFFVDSLQNKGAVRLKWHSVQYVKFGERHALATNIAHVLDSDKNVIDVRSSVYSLYKTDGVWQIFMIQPIKPSQTPFLEPRSVALD